MSTHTHYQTDDGPAAGDDLRLPLQAVVAVDDSQEARSAIRLAGALTAAGRLKPSVVGVDEARLRTVGRSVSRSAGLADTRVGTKGKEEQVRLLRSRARAAWPAATDWPAHVLTGDAATQIDAAARAQAASLVIAGLRRHGRTVQALGLETTVEVVRRDYASVLAVIEGAERVPECIVVGTDFGQAGYRAARLASRLLAPGGRIVLVYAEIALSCETEDCEGFAVIHDKGVRASFEEMGRGLNLPAGAAIEARSIDATPVKALLDTARRERADLIAVGRQHHPFGTRFLLGSITTDLIREAAYSVLVTPQRPWSPRSNT